MGYQSSAVRSNTAPAAQTSSWKADAYLNFYLPQPGNKRFKLVGLPLRNAEEAERILIQWLSADATKGRIKTLKSLITCTYQVGGVKASAGFSFIEGIEAPKPTGDGKKVADGYLNFYLSTATGGTRKLGFVGLYNEDDNQAILVSWLNADPARASVIAEQMDVEYWQKSDKQLFALPS